jgi:glycolate oxidase FAD binding subunit
MITMDHADPFADLIEAGSVRPLEPQSRGLTSNTRILRPVTLEALAEIVLRANTLTVPFAFIGGGTSFAQIPVEFLTRQHGETPLIISLETLNQVVEYHPENFTITVEAGMTVAQLRDVLTAHGQTVVLDTPSSTISTIGGLLAGARLGPRRRALGRTRDAVLGATLVLADGKTIATGSNSLRHAHGYQLARLFCGSYGTLGAYATVTLHTHPMPQARRCAITMLPEGTRDRAIAALERLVVDPTAALFIEGFEQRIPGWEAPDGRLVLFFEGNSEAISRATRDMRSLLGAIGISETRLFDREADALLADILDAPSTRQSPEHAITMRFFPQSETSLSLRTRLHATLRNLNLTADIICDLLHDDVLVNVRTSGHHIVENALRDTFLQFAAECQRADIVYAPQSFRDECEAALQPRVAARNLIDRLRAAFDPNGICGIDLTTIAQ